ncbi:MAG: hypothetical protein JJU42_11905 [Rhodobacteraceae bacterium]|nr:hypothetical protein [Paracoccaceae bacterium]
MSRAPMSRAPMFRAPMFRAPMFRATMFRASMPRPRPIAAPVRAVALCLAAGLGLSACMAPLGMGAPAAAPRAAPGGQVASLPPPSPADVPTASRAERACVEQGAAQGLTVQRVVGTRATTDASGQTTGRDVMLRVSRQGQVYEVRCNYAQATDTARIMSL